MKKKQRDKYKIESCACALRLPIVRQTGCIMVVLVALNRSCRNLGSVLTIFRITAEYISFGAEILYVLL
jgi:hypothetical protein